MITRNYECPTCGLVQRYKIPRAHFCPNDSSLMLPIREDGSIGFSTMKTSAQILIELARGDQHKRYNAKDSAFYTDPTGVAIKDAAIHPMPVRINPEGVKHTPTLTAAQKMIEAQVDINYKGAHTPHHEEIKSLQITRDRHVNSQRAQGNIGTANTLEQDYNKEIEAKKSQYRDQQTGRGKVVERTPSELATAVERSKKGKAKKTKRGSGRHLPLAKEQIAITQRENVAKSMAAELRRKHPVMQSLKRIHTGPQKDMSGFVPARLSPDWKPSTEKWDETRTVISKQQTAAAQRNLRWAMPKVDAAVAKLGEAKKAEGEQFVSEIEKKALADAPKKGKISIQHHPAKVAEVGAMLRNRKTFDPDVAGAILKVSPQEAHQIHDKAQSMLIDSDMRDQVLRKEALKGNPFGELPKPSTKYATLKSLPGKIRKTAGELGGFVKEAGSKTGGNKLKIAGGIGALGLAGAGALMLRDKKKKQQETQLSSRTRIIKFGLEGEIQEGINAVNAFQRTARAVKRTKRVKKAVAESPLFTAYGKRIGNRQVVAGKEYETRKPRGWFNSALGVVAEIESPTSKKVLDGAALRGKPVFEAALKLPGRKGGFTPEVQKMRNDIAQKVVAFRRVRRPFIKQQEIIGKLAKENLETKEMLTYADDLNAKLIQEHGQETKRLQTEVRKKLRGNESTFDEYQKQSESASRNAAAEHRSKTKRARIVAGTTGAAIGTTAGYIAGRKKRDEVNQFSSGQDRKELIQGAAKMGVSAGATGAAMGAVLSLIKRGKGSALSGANVMNALKAGAHTGAFMGAAGTASAPLGSAIMGVPNKNEGAAYTKRGAVGGAILGTVAGGVAGALALKSGKINKFLKGMENRPADFLLRRGPVVRTVIGAGLGGIAGGAHLADEGMQVDAINSSGKKKKSMFSSKMKTISFASKLPVAADRYRKKIAQDEDNRHERDMLRSSVVGGVIGHLMRNRIPIQHSGAILAGMGAGALAQAGVRAMTRKQRDQFGDMPLNAKKAETIPWKAGGLAAAGIIGYRGYKKFRMSARGPIIQFTLRTDEALTRATLAMEDKVKESNKDRTKSWRTAEDVWRKAGRTKRLTRDVIKKVKGEKLVDKRGREYTPEWQKPWAKTAMGVGALGIGVLGIRKGWRGVRKAAAAQRTWGPVSEGVGAGGAWNKLHDFFATPSGGGRSGISKLTTKHGPLKNSPIARKALVSARVAKREVGRAKQDVEDLLGDKVNKAIDHMTGNVGARSAAGQEAIKTQTAIEKHNEIQAQAESILGMQKGRPVPALTSKYPIKKTKNERNLSALVRPIQFESRPAWEISRQYGNQLLLAPPGTQVRDRGAKKKTIEEERAEARRRVYIATGSAAGVTGVGTYIGTQMTPSARRARENEEYAKDFVHSGGELKPVGGEGTLLREERKKFLRGKKRRMGGAVPKSKIVKGVLLTWPV